MMGKYSCNKKDIPLNEIYNGEIFTEITQQHIDGVCDYYMISNYGRVFHKYMGIFMKPGLMTSGYLFISLRLITGKYKLIGVHRLVMIVFHPVPNYENLDINHKSGDKLDNRDINLEWVTRSQNVKHAYDNNLHPKGENVSYSKITEDTAKKIIELLLTNKYDFSEIANMTNSTVSIVASIKQKTAWVYLSDGISFNSRPGRLFKDEDIHNICKYFEDNPIYPREPISYYCKRVLESLNLEYSPRYVDTVRKVYAKKYYKNIVNQYNF